MLTVKHHGRITTYLYFLLKYLRISNAVYPITIPINGTPNTKNKSYPVSFISKSELSILLIVKPKKLLKRKRQYITLRPIYSHIPLQNYLDDLYQDNLPYKLELILKIPLM